MLGFVVVVLVAITETARAATTIDASGCGGAGVAFSSSLPGASLVTSEDCTVSFGSDGGYAKLYLYQQDGVAPAMAGIADHAASVNDWTVGANAFGACLRAIGAGLDPGWIVDGDAACTASNDDPWNAIAALQADSGSLLGETTTAGTSSTASVRFGVRLASAQAAGSYTAPLVFEVIEAIPAAPTNDSPPVISGTVAIGETLTASTGAWSGSPDSYAYQWRSCDGAGASCVDIEGATSSTYVVDQALVDRTIRVIVTATNLGGSTPATSDATTVVPGIAPTAGTVSISGTATTGQTLTASLSGWTAGVPAGTDAYQWRRCDSSGGSCVDIAGATSSTYTLVAADVDSTIRVVATRMNSCTSGCGSDAATSSRTAVVAGIAPTAGTVSISGTATTGQTLTASLSGWTAGVPAGTDAYQWRRCDSSGASCVDIAGATSSTHTLVPDDVDATIRVVATRTNTCVSGCGAATATSGQTAVIAGIAPTAGTVSISGSTRIGSTLSASLSGWNAGTPAGTTTYQWRRCDSSGASCSNVSGATASTYTLTLADGDYTMRVVATITNSCTTGCGPASATSAPTSSVYGDPEVLGEVSTANASNPTSLTVLAPAGTAEGRLLVAQVVLRDAAAAITPPSGWTLIRRTNNSIAMASYYRVATASDVAGSTTYTFSWNVSRPASLGVMSLRWVDTADPVHSSSPATGNSFNPNASSLSITGTFMLVAMWGMEAATNFATPAPMVEQWDLNTNNASAAAATELYVASGSTGDRIAPASSSSNWTGQQIALRSIP